MADDLPFFSNSGGGVTLSGGEPLMQARFTLAFLKECQRLGIHTLLETCGYGEQAAWLDIAEYCDILFYDVKLMDSDKHKEWTGVGNELILDNLRALCNAGFTDKITLRIPCIPGVNDSTGEIAAIARYAKGLGIERMQLLPYNPMSGEKYKWLGADYTLTGKEPRDKEYYEALNQAAEREGLTVIRE
jgi:pyruvate formate lyase activating enzyme